MRWYAWLQIYRIGPAADHATPSPSACYPSQWLALIVLLQPTLLCVAGKVHQLAPSSSRAFFAVYYKRNHIVGVDGPFAYRAGAKDR